MTDTPRIYAACLAAYNAGRLHGAWIDCDQDAEHIGDAIDRMLAASPEPNVTRRSCRDCLRHFDAALTYCPRCGSENISRAFPSAEEYAIHDHEGFAGLIESEWPTIADLPIIAEALAGEHRLGFLWLVKERQIKPAEAAERADEVCIFQTDAHDPAKDYAYELASETIPDFDKLSSQWPYTCIDWEDAGRELVIGGDIDLCDLDGQRFLVTNAHDF